MYDCLRKAISHYQRKFIVPDNTVRFREKELKRQFPFNLLNDAKLFLNFAPVYFKTYRKVLDLALSRLGPTEVLRYLGTATRINRYLVIQILGSYLDRECDKKEKLDFLEYISWGLHYAIARESRCSKVKARRIVSAVRKHEAHLTISPSKAHSLLNAALREYVDFVFLGEHPLSLWTMPPQRCGKYDVVVRRYDGLSLGDVDSVETQEVYPASHQEYGYDLFRGYLSHAPSYRGCLAAFLLVNDQPIDDHFDMCLRLIQMLQRALLTHRCRIRSMKRLEREMKRALDYYFELRTIAEKTGQRFRYPTGLRNELALNSRAMSLKRELGFRTYTETYFATLVRALRDTEKDVL